MNRPQCRIVRIHTFRGDRTDAFKEEFFRALDDEKQGRGRGPTPLECLLFAGHTGLSTDLDINLIYGFNPKINGVPIWLAMNALRHKAAYPGIVRDDTAVFIAAQQRHLAILRFDIALSQRSFTAFQRKLKAQEANCGFYYSFPDGDGDCNCTTWVERLGLPLLTGMMTEFTAVTGVAAQARRRFGVCN